jgi:hypothetical protein
MTQPKTLLGLALVSLLSALNGQELDRAEVRIPYSELKLLLARAEPGASAKAEPRKPALLSARLRLSVENGRPVIDGTFRTASFSPEFSLVPLLAGDVALEKQDPEDAALVTEGEALCIASDRSGTRTLQLRLLPIQTEKGFSLSIPPCPSAIFETGSLPADQSVVLGYQDQEETLAANQTRPLPNTGQILQLRLLDGSATREAMRPPDPSTWTWQHQALVSPSESDLHYQIIARASAASGSGVEALLPLPADAQEISISGEDLISFRKIRGENRSLDVSLLWKTRGILDRQLIIFYQLPLRPLDRTWKLQAPSGKGTRTRFIIANSPLLGYSAEGLSEPTASLGLARVLAERLKGNTCQQLEAESTADLAIHFIPVAATAEGVVNEAEWVLKIEPDGAMLVKGALKIEHKSPIGFVFDVPQGMKLLSCEIEGQSVAPVDLGEGLLKVALPSNGSGTRLSCSITGRSAALDPVEGTMKLSLPKLPLFIHSMLWRLDLPSGYQAETHGNLKRVHGASGDSACRITLQKNLCRDERPEIQVFYQRSDLNR